MLKTGCATLILSTILKKAGSIELSHIVKFGGWCIIGIYFIDFAVGVWSNPPTIVLGFQKFMELITWLLKNQA
jgi:hypothetical protein